MKVNGRIIWQMGRGSIFKLMGRLMKGNGKMIFSKGLELKFGRMGALFLAIIIMEKKMDMGFMCGRMGISMKGNGS